MTPRALPSALRHALDGAGDIPAVFSRMEQEGLAGATRVLRRSSAPLARAFAYLLLREHDLRAVRAVLRGRLLGLPADDIRLAMHRTREGLA